MSYITLNIEDGFNRIVGLVSALEKDYLNLIKLISIASTLALFFCVSLYSDKGVESQRYKPMPEVLLSTQMCDEPNVPLWLFS